MVSWSISIHPPSAVKLHNTKQDVVEGKTKGHNEGLSEREATFMREQEIWLFFMLSSVGCVGLY